MTETNQSTDHFSIGEASERTDLPESTIRYYDREFSEYLSIPRGANNQRLFDEDSLEDLEYIRYLIKRENLSIEDVKERLEKETEYKQKAAESVETDGEASSQTDTLEQTSDEDERDELLTAIKTLEERLETVEENQQKILELLDLNLQRYNKLVEDL